MTGGRGFRSLIFRVSLLAPVLVSAQGIITTVAGRPWTFPGDGKPATGAPLALVSSVAVDAAGNVYASDGTSHIFKIQPNGVLTVFAGTGQCCYSGDGGPATSANLLAKNALALDSAGNLYFPAFFHVVRKVTPAGIISTVAGSGVGGFSGDGGAATAAMLNSPNGVAVDASGNLFISDSGNNRIRKVAPDGTITTFAGNGTAAYGGDGGPAVSASLNNPQGLALDSAGALYITDTGNGRVRKIPRGGAITTVAGNGAMNSFSGDGGPAISAGLNTPSGVSLDNAGNLYIATIYRVRKVTPTGIISTVAGGSTIGYSGDGGPAANASFTLIAGVAADAGGTLYVADYDNRRIRKITAAGIVSTLAGGGPYKSSPDGVLAANAFLNYPVGLAIDKAGNIYVADALDFRIRKIGTNGVISTVAGTGVAGWSTLGAQATASPLLGVTGLALNAAGTVYFVSGYADTICCETPVQYISSTGTLTAVTAIPSLSNGRGISFDPAGNLLVTDAGVPHRVSKVDPSGTVTTVAGNGTVGFSGDGGPATSASLNQPQGTAADTAGNVYIADRDNDRVRKVNPAGIITTFAGNGTRGFSGDGGPAVNAMLNHPTSLAFDRAGNLFIGENDRVRKVDAAGIITAVAGGGFGSGDGGRAVNASLAPTAIAFDSGGNLYIADANGFIRKVLATAPTFSASPTTLSFTAPAGTPQAGSQQVATSSNVTGLIWGVQSSTTDGTPWLGFSAPFGYTPGSVTVNVSTVGLKPGNYQGNVTLQAPFAATPNQNVGVNLTVTVSGPPQLAVAPSNLSYQILTGSGNPPPQTITIGNGGDSVINWTAQVTTAAGIASWLSLSATSGTATASVPAIVQARVNLAGLASGVYSGSIAVSSSTTSQKQTIPVTLVLTAPAATILLSQTGLTFTAVVGGGNVPSQSIGVLNTGQGTMNWTAVATALDGGNWLSVSPMAGTSTANSLQVPLTSVGVNAGGLSAGQYTGQIAVSASGASNNPQYAIVILNVLPRGSPLPVVVRPTGLIFASQAAAAGSLPAQTVTLATGAPADVGFASGVLTYDGGTWLASGTNNSAVPSGGSTTVSILPNLSGLSAGVYRGGMTVLFSDGSPSQVVDILSVVVPGSSAPSQEGGPAAAGCTPQRLQMVQQTLSSNFGTPVGYPTSLQAQVVDDCGNAVANATVLAAFSNGDPPVSLVTLGNGTYVGNWQPARVGQVIISFRALLPPLTPAATQSQGSVGANPGAPQLYTGGVVSAASYAPGGVLSPGEIVSAFGLNLAGATAQAPSLPLPNTLGGSAVQIGGTNVPLFYASNGQVNAQLPFELTPGSQPQVVVRGASFIAPPQAITIVPATPSIFTLTQDGKGQGAILNAQNILVNAAAPATAGNTVAVYATGLGATSPTVASGVAAPGTEPLARVATPVTALVDGKPALVSFAGLAPGYVGLYQVNVQIPTGVSTGPAISLILSQSGVNSNTVSLAIR